MGEDQYTSWAWELLWEEEQLQKALDRYPTLMANPSDRRRIMISTDDVWGGSWSPVHTESDELPWRMNPYLDDD